MVIEIKEELIRILSSLGLKYEDNSKEGVSIFVKNKLNMPIGRFSLSNEETKTLNFNVYDPTISGLSIEGGCCSLEIQSVKEIIESFSYFPISVELKDKNGIHYVELDELFKTNTSNIEYYKNLISRYVDSVPDLYYDVKKEDDKSIDNLIEIMFKEKPSATCLILGS